MQDIQLLYKISVESKQKSINTKELFVKIFRFLYIFGEFGLLCAAAAAATIPLTFWRLEPSQEISFSSLPVEPTFLWSMHVWITRGIFVSCLLSIMADKENSFHYILFALGLPLLARQSHGHLYNGQLSLHFLFWQVISLRISLMRGQTLFWVL